MILRFPSSLTIPRIKYVLIARTAVYPHAIAASRGNGSVGSAQTNAVETREEDTGGGEYDDDRVENDDAVHGTCSD